jgi:copper resistance protein B
MTRLSIALLLFGSALAVSPRPVTAQQMDPNMPMPMSMPMPPAKPAAPTKTKPKGTHKKHKPAATAAPAKVTKPAMDHDGMDQDAMGHGLPMPQGAPEKGTVDHSGMDMAMPMPGHDMSGMSMDHSAMPGMSMASTEPREPIPVVTDADRAAARPPPHDHPVHDNSIQHYTLVDRLETWNSDHGGALEWDIQNWNGTDLNRLWLRSEGVRVGDRTEDADLEVLYGRSVATWWDVVAGVRHDFKPGDSQDFAAIGVMGVAPYKFDVEATAYVGQSGQTAARVEVEYETLLTNKLILQPRIEANLYGQDDERRGIGSGLSTIEAGLRLRYEFTRRFAPYVGVVREQACGDTARYRRAEGHDSNDTRLVAGIRIWF